ncbi:hypothetical protein C4J81_00560 [Deltaproteobacteria bacterium Smac51]|nr:hypothetical protein C4J81_00560 [Deltaproteobacteria bacterium Smac51]
MSDDRRNLYSCPSTRRRRKRGQQKQALGRSRGGFTSKLHVSVDALGNPIGIILTGGQISDIKVGPELLSEHSDCNVIADKGYDSNDVVEAIESNNCRAVIPPRSNRKVQRDYDRFLYKERHLVENFFSKIKEYRKIATRYDKRADVFLSFVYSAAALICLR